MIWRFWGYDKNLSPALSEGEGEFESGLWRETVVCRNLPAAGRPTYGGLSELRFVRFKD